MCPMWYRLHQGGKITASPRICIMDNHLEAVFYHKKFFSHELHEFTLKVVTHSCKLV